MIARLPLPLAIAGICVLAAVPGAWAAGATQGIATAADHAGMVASSDQIGTAQAHLHHVINCLVGPKGAGYDATQEDPCKGQGAGAIPDASGKQKKHLQAAVKKAQAGLKETDLAKVQATAKSVQGDLQKAQK